MANSTTSKKKHFKLEPLNIENFIKVNTLEGITNPIFFNSNNLPNSDGLLSNEIFGITKDDRANTFAYISLGKTEVFMHPLFYKTWGKMDSKIKDCVHGVKTFRIDKEGQLVEDINGGTGIKFLYDNFNKIKIKPSESRRRNDAIKFIYKYKKVMFVHDMVVIPAYYRDVNTENGRYTGVGDINKLYNSLLIASRSLAESNDYGLNLSDTIRGRIQELLVQIYDYFTKGVFEGSPTIGIAGKFGVLRRANMSKTIDYSARLVLSAPDLLVENMDDMITDIDHAAVPLAAVAANFYPYILFYMRRFFENIFAGVSKNAKAVYQNDDTGEIKDIGTVDVDYRTEFSDVRLKEELYRYIHAYSSRLEPITYKVKGMKNPGTMRLVGYQMTEEEYKKAMEKNIANMPVIERDMTWCDLIFIAAVSVTKDKICLITRYPMDSYFNQFPIKINVSSTIRTEPMVIDKTFYRFYPYIRPEMIGSNTSNLFTDTLKISNLYLDSIGGDYDGDQVSSKSVYSIEANAELESLMQKKSHYISLNALTVLNSNLEAVQSIYNLTLVLPDDMKKLVDPIF